MFIENPIKLKKRATIVMDCFNAALILIGTKVVEKAGKNLIYKHISHS